MGADELTPTQWMDQYDKSKKEVLRQRSTGTLCPEKTLADLSKTVNKLFVSLKTMRAKFGDEISQGELSRREIIVENLKNQLPLMSSNHLLQSGASVSSSSTGGNQSQSQRAKGGSSSDAIEMNSVGKPTQNPIQNNRNNQFSDKGLLQRQEEVIKIQDQIVNEISTGVDKLHDQAQDIGQEVKISVNLMDDLEDTVDYAADDLRNEAKHAEKVRLKSQVCHLYLCLLLEIVVMAILLFIVFKYEGGFNN